MAAYITVYSLCVFYYSVLSCVADVADCSLQRLSAIVIKRHYYYYYYYKLKLIAELVITLI